MRPFVVVAIVLVACGKGRPEKPAAIQSSVALQKAASCQDLTRVVQDTAVRQMRSQLDQAKDWTLVYWGAPAVAGAGAAPAAQGAPASYSTTNTQVAGVDESDFVKNDGTRIFALSGQTLFAAKSWPPQDLALAGKLDLEGWPSSMFLDKDQPVTNVKTLDELKHCKLENATVSDKIDDQVAKIGENGITRDDILVHDPADDNLGLQVALINMALPEFPVAMGVIRSVDAPVYDQEMKKQISTVQAKRKVTCMDELLKSGNTWTVDGENCSEPVKFFDNKCFG